MKNKRNSERDDYRLLKNKLLIRIFGMLFFAFAFLAALYSLFLKGHIADTFVGFLDNFVYHDYDRAYNVYSIYIRDYMSIFFVVLSLLLFAIILRFYLNEFSKYFKEINRSIDALIEENSGDIVLPSELTAIEKKINHIKHTLEQRKLAAELSEQRKNDLVVYLAHDLKTPLTSVIGYLTLLRDENKISEELREKYLSISLEKAEHLEDLMIDGNKYAKNKSEALLPNTVFETSSLMLNENSGFDMKYQINKVHNLKLAARTINKVIIEPNETFSFWQLVRWADHHEKYKDELNLVKQVFIELQLKGSNSV